MPTIPSIRTSIENKNVLVLDEHAKKGIFERDTRNRLIAYAGGFTVVFPYNTQDGKKWAFRCWHSDVSNTKNRYETIAKAIRKAQLDFLCDFDYIEKGINVEGIIYPTTRMRWVDGVTIKDYIYQNKDSKNTLKSLAENFLKMTLALHEQSLAHGDLQHGNILVDGNHHLHLVDYDSFYCPKLKGEPDTVTGLPDYQHPSRKGNNFVSEKLDYFSELIIYLSIIAIAENPSLADKYKIKDADRLLFSKEDFKDITHSQVYNDIILLGKDFVDLLKILENYLEHTDIHELIPFGIALQENSISFISSAIKAVRNIQPINLTWNVPFEAKVFLTYVGKEEPQECQNSGSFTTNLAESTTFELSVKTDNGLLIKKHIYIEVFDECDISFSADKYFIFPKIPVILSWNVKHAKSVWLNDEVVNCSGEKMVEPSKATVYIISAEDEFGKKEMKVEIQMLPIPQVKSLLVPAPNIISNLPLTIKQPRFNVGVRFPSINFGFIKTEPPKIPSLTDLGINVENNDSSKKYNLGDIITKGYYLIKKKTDNYINKIINHLDKIINDLKMTNHE